MLDKINKNSKNTLEMRFALASDLRKIRMLKELSVDDVAKKANVHKHYIMDFELGIVRDWDILCRLMKFYEKRIRLELY